MRGVLVDLRNDDEGWIPLEVEYRPASVDLPMSYTIIRPYPELSSHLRHVATDRGARLARSLHLIYIAHHL